MNEMRQCWINVYVHSSGHRMLGYGQTRARAEELARKLTACRVPYRLRVRLKPEGAPRRYADWLERHDWEKGILPDRRLPLSGVAYEAAP